MAARQNQEGKCKEKWNYSSMSILFFTELHKTSPGKLGEGYFNNYLSPSLRPIIAIGS